MVNDIIFSNSFHFRRFVYEKYKYTDNRHGIDTHYLAYMVSGRCKITTDMQTVYISEGDVFYIPNGCKYQSFWYGESKIEFISLAFVFMPNTDGLYYPLQSFAADEKIRDMFLTVETDTASADSIASFYSLFAHVSRLMAHTVESGQSKLVSRAKQYLVNNPCCTVAEVARALTVSESALYAAFKKHSDISINSFRNTALMERAKALITSTDKSIEDISDMLNISSASYFRKLFRAHFGLTPKQMRKMHGI